MQAYVKLNQEGRDKVMDLMEDFGQIKKYKGIQSIIKSFPFLKQFLCRKWHEDRC